AVGQAVAVRGADDPAAGARAPAPPPPAPPPTPRAALGHPALPPRRPALLDHRDHAARVGIQSLGILSRHRAATTTTATTARVLIVRAPKPPHLRTLPAASGHRAACLSLPLSVAQARMSRTSEPALRPHPCACYAEAAS